MKSINQKIIFFFFILLSFGFQCDNYEDNRFENIYELEFPFEIVPVQKEYKINDTIQISTFIKDRSLKDLYTQNQIKIECTDIPIRFYVGVRFSKFNLLESPNLFEIMIDTLNLQDYQIENNGQYSNIEANISEDKFDNGKISLMKIIPKRQGIFMMNPSYFRDIFINRNENCNETNPTLDKGKMNPIFDVENSNPQLLSESPLPPNVFISGDDIPQLTKEKKIFWFRVIE